MSHLILQGDKIIYHGLLLLDENNLAVKLNDTGSNFLVLDFLILSGTASIQIASSGAASGTNVLGQLAEMNNKLTTVTINGSVSFFLGGTGNQANSADGVVTDTAATATSPTTIQSSLKLIDASGTTGGVTIAAGATNASGAGNFFDGASPNPDVTITYTGLTIKGGSGNDSIENDAKNGVVIDGNGVDTIILGGAGAKAILGNGTHDTVMVGTSFLGTNETVGSALGDKVILGFAATAELVVGPGATAGLTAGTASIGVTKVVNAAAGMKIDFTSITISSKIADETATVASSISLTAAENAAVDALGSPGVAYFTYAGNEYFIATNHAEGAVGTGDAIVKLVGVHDLHASSPLGLVTLHA
jgi:hypothetical protein